MLTRVSDKVPHYEIVVGISHFCNYQKLVFKAVCNGFIRSFSVSLVHSVTAKSAEILHVVGNALYRELRQLYIAEFKLNIAAFRYLYCISDSIFVSRKSSAISSADFT